VSRYDLFVLDEKDADGDRDAVTPVEDVADCARVVQICIVVELSVDLATLLHTEFDCRIAGVKRMTHDKRDDEWRFEVYFEDTGVFEIVCNRNSVII